MKLRKTLPALALASIVTLAGCGGGAKEKESVALRNQIAVLQVENEAVKKENEAVKTDLSAAQSQNKSLQSELASKSETLAQTQKAKDDLQSRLKFISDTEAVEYYKFTFGGVAYDWALRIPLGTYFYYKDQTRINDFSAFGAMINDSKADSVLNVLVRNMQDAARSYDLKKSDIVNLVTAFTQTLPHTDTDASTSYDTYNRYPVETLFEQGGDSADTAILAAALLARQNYDVVLFVYEQQKHIALGINLASSGTSLEFQGNRYYYLETMGRGTGGTRWQLGEVPQPYRDVKPLIVPVSR